MFFPGSFQKSATPYYPDFVNIIFFWKNNFPSKKFCDTVLLAHLFLVTKTRKVEKKHETCGICYSWNTKWVKKNFGFVWLCSLWIQYFFKRKNTFYVKPFNSGPIDGDFLEKSCMFFRQALWKSIVKKCTVYVFISFMSCRQAKNSVQ